MNSPKKLVMLTKSICLGLVISLMIIFQGDLGLDQKVSASSTRPSEFDVLSLCKSVDQGNSVTVNDLRFETCISERKIVIPPQRENASTFIGFGIHVTNVSHKPIRFYKYAKLNLEILREDGERIQERHGYDRLTTISPDDFTLLLPGDKTVVLIEGWFRWRSSNNLIVTTYNHSLPEEFQYFGGWKSGIYKVRLTYENEQNDGGLSENARKKFSLNDLWTGKVTTSFLDFSLFNK
jgi:hypothetical protein